MASNYNRRPLPAEVLVDDGRWRVIRRRQTVDDMLETRRSTLTIARVCDDELRTERRATR